MLLAIGNGEEFAQICQKLPKIAKIYPKIISLRNFEIPPKNEILMVFKRQKISVKKITPKHVLTIWIFNTIMLEMSF
jgi:hypothetical protein